jgi:toxin ParE1/3/4
LARFSRSRLAEQDLEEIWFTIAGDNVAAADALLDRIEAKCELLATHRELGRARPEIREGLRSFTVGNYILFYRTEPGGIELVRVLHGARDLPNELPAD